MELRHLVEDKGLIMYGNFCHLYWELYNLTQIYLTSPKPVCACVGMFVCSASWEPCGHAQCTAAVVNKQEPLTSVVTLQSKANVITAINLAEIRVIIKDLNI